MRVRKRETFVCDRHLIVTTDPGNEPNVRSLSSLHASARACATEPLVGKQKKTERRRRRKRRARGKLRRKRKNAFHFRRLYKVGEEKTEHKSRSKSRSVGHTNTWRRKKKRVKKHSNTWLT